MQHDLKLLEQRWDMALQSAGFGVWDLDPCREQVHYSPQWKAMLGYGASDEADRTAVWRERVHPDDLEPMLTALRAHLAGHAPGYEHEFRLRAADGTYRWVLSRGRVVERAADGQALRMIGTLTDISDRREAESLRAQRDRAEAANRAKTEFLSRMSHELRTPLNAVLGFAQLLTQQIGKADAREQRRNVRHIEQAGWHLLAMINDMLDLSRVESGQLEMRIQPAALLPLVREVCGMLGPAARAAGVEVRVLDAPATAGALVDPLRFKQVLTNLLSNGIKYNRPGGSVTVALRSDADSCTLSVADTGLGIPAQAMPQLFEPFNRLGREESTVEGVGIGLVLTRWLITQMGGRIAVHSTENLGSTFEVTLQPVPQDQAPRVIAVRESPVPAAPTFAGPAAAA